MKQNKKVLLIIPNDHDTYQTKVRVAMYSVPPVNMATISTPLIKAGHHVEILNLNLMKNNLNTVRDRVSNLLPDYVGVTFKTPCFYDAVEIGKIVKENNPGTILICGGPHTSSFPEDTLLDSPFDIAVVGEGDFTLEEIVSGKPCEEIKGICFKDEDGRIIMNERRKQIKDLDNLPLPSWHLYNLRDYKSPRVVCKKNPVGIMETSRGCVYSCIYCNKSVFGNNFRVKSPERVVDEMEFMLQSGFREIWIADDMFSTNINRAKSICDLIIKRELKFPWALFNGIRVDFVDEELCYKMKKSGCYYVSVGVESGNQKVLDSTDKRITLEQVREAFRHLRKAHIMIQAYFMFGLPQDTEASMQDTIDFAKELLPDIPKAAITVPLPATPLYEGLHRKGRIKTNDWRAYNQQTTKELFVHPNLSWEIICEYNRRFYKELYLNPKYIFQRIRRGLTDGQIFWDCYYFLKSLRYKW
ncbi:MAG: B12-binding domain-containing radical SAM protein [Candidatus Scalinduaceae bacterium]